MESLKNIYSVSQRGQFHTAYFTSKLYTLKKPSKNVPSSEFLMKLNSLLLKHLSDEELNVRRLTLLIGMSRTDLHRKLTRIVGKSTTEYIRHFRLNRAAELLLTHSEWNIYQVAIEVGFGTQSYFTKKFKEVFGICPTAWRKLNGHLEHM